MTKRERIWQQIELVSIKIEELEKGDRGSFKYRDSVDYWWDLSSRLNNKWREMTNDAS